jgi:SAM-dependent methyltransferase
MNKAESSEYLMNSLTNRSDFKFEDPTGAVSGRDFLVKIAKKYTKCSGNALDIGTFSGRFCFILGSLGFKAYGIEPQKNAVESAKKYGLEVFWGSFPDTVPQEILRRKYDLVSALDSIYYVDDIEKTLRIINGILSDDGLLLIKCHQGYSRYYYDETHSYFLRCGDNVQWISTVESLRYYLRLAGFKIVKIFGENPTELLPFGLGRIKNAFLRKAIYKIYNITMLECTSLDIKRADRLVVLAKKTGKADICHN